MPRLGTAARKAAAHLVIGVIEKDGGTLYCTALFFGPDGSLLGKHRKTMPTSMERLIWGFGDGSTLTVLDTNIGRLGAVICWENYMPLLRTAMYAKGVEIYCAPTADDATHGCRRCNMSRWKAAASQAEEDLGWTAGAGLEFIISGPLRAKVEYLHVNNDDDYTCTAACGGGPVSFDLNEDIIRAGLNYRFWMN
jgi:predicted amidohydrolase